MSTTGEDINDPFREFWARKPYADWSISCPTLMSLSANNEAKRDHTWSGTPDSAGQPREGPQATPRHDLDPGHARLRTTSDPPGVELAKRGRRSDNSDLTQLLGLRSVTGMRVAIVDRGHEAGPMQRQDHAGLVPVMTLQERRTMLLPGWSLLSAEAEADGGGEG